MTTPELTLFQRFALVECSREICPLDQIEVQDGLGLVIAVILLEIIDRLPVERDLPPEFRRVLCCRK